MAADLSKIPFDDLRAEVARRKKIEDAERQEAFRLAHPCPECGGDPTCLNTEMVEEFRFAPRDAEGHPRLYAPYEEGTTKGGRYRVTLTCVNDHVTSRDEIVWFDKT